MTSVDGSTWAPWWWGFSGETQKRAVRRVRGRVSGGLSQDKVSQRRTLCSKWSLSCWQMTNGSFVMVTISRQSEKYEKAWHRNRGTFPKSM